MRRQNGRAPRADIVTSVADDLCLSSCDISDRLAIVWVSHDEVVDLYFRDGRNPFQRSQVSPAQIEAER